MRKVDRIAKTDEFAIITVANFICFYNKKRLYLNKYNFIINNIPEAIMELTLTAENFKSEVLESDLPVLVDFWASWCGPCRMMGPVVSEIAEEKKGVLKVGKVNVDEQESLAAQFSVMSIPTFILFKNGKAAARQTGAMSKADLLKSLGV